MRKKHIILASAMLALLCSLPARSYTRPQDVTALRESYDRLRADGSTANQRDFFDRFPSQWSDFTVMLEASETAYRYFHHGVTFRE